jgi:hypothetical protein
MYNFTELKQKAKRLFWRDRKREEAEEIGEETIEGIGYAIDKAYVPHRTINKEWEITKEIEGLSEEIGKRKEGYGSEAKLWNIKKQIERLLSWIEAEGQGSEEEKKEIKEDMERIKKAADDYIRIVMEICPKKEEGKRL